MMPSTSVRSLSIVIIDSDPAVTSTIKNLLLSRGIHAVRESDNPSGGLRLVREHRADIIFLEITASQAPALETVQKIRAEFPQAGIVVSSSDSSPQLILRCM